MKHEFLLSLVIIFGASAFMVFLLNKLKISSIVGFLITGIIIGPFGFALISNIKEIEVYAEIGIILLLFTLGMEFSLEKLLRMKRIVFGAGSIQVFGTILLVVLISVFILKLPLNTSFFWGFLITMSSTAIILKLIKEKNEISTPHGRAIIGIQLFGDLSVVLFFIILPLISDINYLTIKDITISFIKFFVVIVFVILGSKWLVPFIFEQIVKTKSRELFIISIILFCIGTSLFTNQMGLSLSLGAFLAGMMLSESEYAYQATADIVPFKESFMGLFFVSIGMLLDIQIAIYNIIPILILFFCIILLKMIIGFFSTYFIGFTIRTSILTAVGIAQIGEFSFVIAMEGRLYGLIDNNLYQIFIATSILTMFATPFLYNFAHPFSAWILKKQKNIKKHNALLYNKEFLSRGTKSEHVIIVGFGFNGQKLAMILKQSDIPYVILDFDMPKVKKFKSKGEPIYYGDATSTDILDHIGIKNAKMLICTISNAISQRTIISNARKINNCIYIITRTRHVKSVEELKNLGANDVIPEEFETSLEIFHRVFLYYNIPNSEIKETLEKIRQNNYSLLRDSSEDKMSLIGQLNCASEVDIKSFKIEGNSFLIDKTIRELDIRKKTGVSILAIRRKGSLITTPNLEVNLSENDILLFTGDFKSIQNAYNFFKNNTKD